MTSDANQDRKARRLKRKVRRVRFRQDQRGCDRPEGDFGGHQTTHALSLNVDASGVEGLGVTDENDLPLFAGEKVGRYRFLSFYLEPSVSNFDDFFNEVVDPEWLASNSEEARALRQTQAGKPNSTWRVLHRVTFVERPALAGFGRDTRPVTSAQAVFSLEQAVKDLQAENAELKQKLDQILEFVRPKAKVAGQ